jgi:predicted esterase
MRPIVLACLLLVAGPVRADDLPYPAGRSEHTLEGLATTLLIPDRVSAEHPCSLVVLLHGAGDNGANLANAMAAWTDLGYAVVAPSARGQVWSNADVDAAIRIAVHLKEKLPIDPERIHAVGFSNGGWNLAPVAFSDELKCCSATWIAAGYKGGKVPRWAKKKLGVLALAGEQDPNAAAARATVPALDGKVRSVEARFQPNLGHKWPRDLMPYMQWWMGVQEGRFNPGKDLNFEYGEDLEEAVTKLKDAKRGGIFAYVYSPDDKDNADARELQNEVLLDRLVRHYGNQLQALRFIHGPETEAMGVKKTPAIVVMDKTGKVKKVLQGRIKAKSLAGALRSVAPDKKRPKD